jgi:sec-independent protein translocase protein TatC
MIRQTTNPDASMSLLEHLDELRSRLVRALVAYGLALAACWIFSEQLLSVMLRPVRRHLEGRGEIVFTNLTEPFLVYMKAAAVAAVFLVAPYLLYQLWAFVAPGLHRNERRLVVPFLVFGTLFFAAGGYFGYAVATPYAAAWFIELGRAYRSMLTLRSVFQFESRIILGMAAVFELPILIFFLTRIGVVSPALLLRHFRTAVLVITVVAAVVTPTGDVVTLAIFAGPMVLLYLLGVAVSWLFSARSPA